MGFKVTEWLVANIVMIGPGLLASEEEIHTFGQHIPHQVRLQTMTNPDNRPIANRIEIPKDRIVIEMVPDRSSIEKEYPDENWTRLAEVARFAIEASKNLEIKAHGYNFSLVYQQESAPTAYEYIAARFIRPQEVLDWNLTGGSAELCFPR